MTILSGSAFDDDEDKSLANDIMEQTMSEILGPLPLVGQIPNIFMYNSSTSKSAAFKGLELTENLLKKGRNIVDYPFSEENLVGFFKSLVDVSAYSVGAGNVRRVYETAAEGFYEIFEGETVNPFSLFFRK